MVSVGGGLSPEKKKFIKKIIQNVRIRLLNEFGDIDHDLMVYAGNTFNSDENVLARIEKVSNMETIRDIGWEQAVRCTLIDAMLADYWNNFGKKQMEHENDIG